uniref:Macaca fascicularis brain cDNA clone: QflA-18111, similar to human hypothetical gene supported by AK097527 (LOC400522), mRNA, RefSeq: XM_378579.1 n=1 Tax=Macaca fascicularis TaxID=9541 RepID=I7GC28_MACFA|nr:unnamed protein product [Macaca fascicularis]
MEVRSLLQVVKTVGFSKRPSVLHSSLGNRKRSHLQIKEKKKRSVLAVG